MTTAPNSWEFDKFPTKLSKTFKQYVENNLKNEEFKSLFWNFFEDSYLHQCFSLYIRNSIRYNLERFLYSILRNYTIRHFSWKQYCVSMKCIREYKTWSDKTKRIARKMLSDLYLYTIENIHLNIVDFNELKENKEFLIQEERRTTLGKNEYFLDRISTNFPLDSSLDQLHFIAEGQMITRDYKSSKANILNLNISNSQIKALLIGFYQSEEQQPLLLRYFLYLFRYSLMSMNKEPHSITDFTFEVFKKQYRFYQNQRLNELTLVFNEKSYKLSRYLVRFYMYLCKVIKEQHIQHNIFEGTFYNEHILGKKCFSVYYEKGYKLIHYNPFEEVPLENRWQLIPSDGYANTNKNRPCGIDFLQIKDKSLREDLKYYAWKQTSMSVRTMARNIYTIIEFLNFISSYKQLNKFGENVYVNADLLEQWSFYIGGKETNTNTINGYIKGCRSFLKFYKKKYQIPILLIDMLRQKPQDYDGGNPMTKHDINLFSKKFQEKRSQSIMGELCYIIFNLATTTKIRFGEILNLERDCILEKYEQAGVIKYYSKGSGNQKIKVTLTIEKINLIEKAASLTENAYSKASTDIKKYIFLKEDDQIKGRIIDFTWQFWNVFSKNQKELEGQLDGKYRPYDLRSTFINNIYTEGINDKIPTSVIVQMSGNSIHTAKKYYRKATEAQTYAEIFAGVTVSSVDVYGNILEEKDIEVLNPVEDGLGGCNQGSCVIEEEQYECLICPHFATTTNRIPLFKKHITRLKTLKEGILNSQERGIIEAQLKLYTAYYVKLLEKNGGEQDGEKV
ncbi:tyrosine-type recombinase/integrase [Bacillus thuringiensis]|uniref:tyrosine-type recombinase/integrase n=1 Tax=Bacillus thuringiensis TaxID=1428 RepID=UPI002AB32E4A|nr:site-specific integrase [Bacillus thuringiensis]MDY8161901.1 site-specific integrase [Bacillus thuringiensis]